MQLVLLTFVIGALNLCIGYGLAVSLGYGPPTLWDTWEVLRAPRPTTGISSDQISAIEDVIQGLEWESVSSPEGSLHAEPGKVSDPVVEPELSDLDALHQLVEKDTSSLADLVARLKKGDAGQHGRTAWSFVGELQEICKPYLQALTETTEQIFDDAGDSGRATAVSDEVEQIVLEQASQLETTLSNLQYMDFDSGMSTAMMRLTSETENMLSTARRLQKALEVALTD